MLLREVDKMSDLRSQSTYSYPSPATNTTLPRTDISLREILDTYRDNNDLLKQILSAKVEEDRVPYFTFFFFFVIFFVIFFCEIIIKTRSFIFIN
jgi:hypothetical protein